MGESTAKGYAVEGFPPIGTGRWHCPAICKRPGFGFFAGSCAPRAHFKPAAVSVPEKGREGPGAVRRGLPQEPICEVDGISDESTGQDLGGRCVTFLPFRRASPRRQFRIVAGRRHGRLRL